MSIDRVRGSVIVPVYNNARDIGECLSALTACSAFTTEIIVVDDASTDESPSVAASLGARVLRLPKNSGPSAARNYGARQAVGEILLFVDADVLVMPSHIDRLLTVLEEQPNIAAIFGSYDAEPRASGLISGYRNLLHHFMHQNGNQEASTFWAGCGAIRRSVFEEIGGFDEKQFRHSSIEDIELGYRLRRAGYRILLDKRVQATHLKKWTLRSMISTDVSARAVPWAKLIIQTKKAPDDLNLKRGQRLSVALTGLAGVSLLFAPLRPELLHFSMAALIAIFFLNRKLYAFFFRQRGIFFAIRCIPLHLLYYLYSGSSYLFAWLDFQRRRLEDSAK